MAEISLRRLRSADLDAALSITRMAQWNQVVDDWRDFLALAPDGCLAAVQDGAVVGTAVGMSLAPELGWVSMVLVDGSYRRKGIGSALVTAVREHLSDTGHTSVMLDATPTGAEVYRSIGFTPVGSVTRLRRPATPSDEWPGGRPAPAGSESGSESEWRDTSKDELDRIAEFDHRATGVDRGRILRTLLTRDGVRLRVLESQGRLIGYGAVRPGHQAQQLGPVVAADAETASVLAADLAQQSTGPLLADVVNDTPAAKGLTAALGFMPERDFTRMARGWPWPLHPGVALIAGPDWG